MHCREDEQDIDDEFVDEDEDAAWPTQGHDLNVAECIIHKHTLYDCEHPDNPLEVMRVLVDQESHQAVDIEMADWVIEMIGFFREHYGHEHGHAVIGNIMTRLLLQNETRH